MHRPYIPKADGKQCPLAVAEADARRFWDDMRKRFAE
jgi:hypothetical protein